MNGVANNSRMGGYEANADVLNGVKFLATLDSRTSKICALLDGTTWTMEEVKKRLVKRPPLHPNCRKAGTVDQEADGSQYVKRSPEYRKYLRG
jgi:hypothetical protein